MKRRLTAQSDRTINQSENTGGIKFKQSNHRRKAILFVKGITIVTISTVFGTMAGLYVVNKYYPQTAKVQSIFKVAEKGNSYAVKQENMDKLAKSIVSISNSENGFKQNLKINTSGIIIRSNGYIISSYNAISKIDPIVVKIPSIGVNGYYKGKIIGFDDITDVAVIKIQKENLETPNMGTMYSLKVGDNVMSVGNSTGDNYLGFAATGMINSLNKKIELEGKNDTDKISYNVIQTNAPISSENVGGALVDEYGEVIGLNSKYISDIYSKPPYNYVILINEVQDVANSLIDYGRVKRTSLGFDGVEIEDKYRKGIYVQNVESNGAAKKAGILPLDIILSIDGKEISTLDDITNCMKSHKAGDKIKCKILRRSKKIEVTIVLEEAK